MLLRHVPVPRAEGLLDRVTLIRVTAKLCHRELVEGRRNVLRGYV